MRITNDGHHRYAWMLYDVRQLSAEALKALSGNDSCVSIASLWEMSIKQTLGKITLPHTIPQIAEKCEQMGVDILSTTPVHCQRIQTLPLYHHDPFDRIIMAQSLVEHRPLVTRDAKIWNSYSEIEKIW